MLKLRWFSVWFATPAVLAQAAGCGGGNEGDRAAAGYPEFFIRSASK